MTLLTEDLKTHIQVAYSRWLTSRTFRPRRGQREMIAAVARTCGGAGRRFAAIEAGTGTGKTAAYCLAAIPVAEALDKTVVIASATVALQEQIVMRDLPDLAEHAGLKFGFALAKGRGRYVCPKRLDERLHPTQNLPLFHADDEVDEEYASVHQEMLNAFSTGRWDGELDSWPDGVEEPAWRPLTTDHAGCTNNRCKFFNACPFFKARAQLDGVRVVVANQDLLLADLSLGGGVILPPPEDCIVVVDEAHHLPAKTQQHFAARAWVRGSGTWAEQVNTVVASLTQRFGRPRELKELAPRLAERSETFKTHMGALGDSLAGLSFAERRDGLRSCRFPLGRVDPGIVDAAETAAGSLAELSESVSRVYELLQGAADGELGWEKGFEAEDWLPVVGQLEARAETVGRLLADYASATAEQEDALRCARWIDHTDQDFELISAPIETGQLLEQSLWSRCFAAIATSATLTAMGRFDRFFDRAGMAGIQGVRIPSPFDFSSIATLRVPKMRTDPRDSAAHTAEIAELLPALLGEEVSALVLFTSWRQLNGVKAALPESLEKALQIQGEHSKQTLLKRHRERVDAGRPSYLLGLASFAEGVDLPDDYCRHVILAKLPFAAPDDPVDEAIAEWARAEGRNAFLDITLPDAAVRLVQACGRLIRHEQDHGRITILDKRLVTQRYGRDLLDSLPPYRRELPPGQPA